MSIKPIDMQVNVGQMHEVAKGSQVRSDAIVEQQHVLDRESSEKSNSINSKLEENKKAERTVIKREERKERRRGEVMGRRKEKEKEGQRQDQPVISHDERMGRIIDIKK